jgi:hypothetical protein
VNRARRRTTQRIAPTLSAAERRATWAEFIERVGSPVVADLDRIVALSSGWKAPAIATSVGLAVAFKLLGHESDQRTLEELILRDNHTEEPDPVSKSILRHAAIHEAGHAIWAAHVWGPDAITAVALTGPPPTLGQTLVADAVLALPMDRGQRRRLVGMAFAGAIAEQVIFGPDHPAVGAEYDIDQAWWELNQRGTPRSDRGEAGFAARWAEVEALLHSRRETIEVLSEAVLAEPSRLLMGLELRRVLGSDLGSTRAAA